MPRVKVEWIEGRTQAQREEIARRVTQVFVDVVGVTPDRVQVVFFEYPATHHFKAGVLSRTGHAGTVDTR
jgi:4-oxalocrotonate tautomerase family enzyme